VFITLLNLWGITLFKPFGDLQIDPKLEAVLCLLIYLLSGEVPRDRSPSALSSKIRKQSPILRLGSLEENFKLLHSILYQLDRDQEAKGVEAIRH
jgi:hypothetical protein